MSIATDVSRIKGNITAALTAIADKGVTVPDGSTSDALASLIASIEAGGGEKIARGTFIPAETASLSKAYKIEHNCGFVPDVFIVLKEDNDTYAQYSIRLAVSFPSSFYGDDYVNIDRKDYTSHAYGWTSASYSMYGGSYSFYNETTDKVAYIRSSSQNNKVLAGQSYAWIAIGGGII